MPPRQRPLTPEELGLLKLWIDQGARQSSTTSLLPRLKWKAIPGALNPVYSAAISPDGNYAACGRSNRILVYDLASGQLAARLIDPSLNQGDLYGEPGVSHRDMVHSLAFSPKGALLVSGGYRTLKFWRLQTSGQTPNPTETASRRAGSILGAGAGGRIGGRSRGAAGQGNGIGLQSRWPTAGHRKWRPFQKRGTQDLACAEWNTRGSR